MEDEKEPLKEESASEAPVNKEEGRVKKRKLLFILLGILAILLIVLIIFVPGWYGSRTAGVNTSLTTTTKKVSTTTTKDSTTTTIKATTSTTKGAVLTTTTQTSLVTITTTTTVPFAVTEVTVSANPDTFCGLTEVTFTANITANRAGTVTYHWVRSDGNVGSNEMVNFTSAGTKQVTTVWTIGQYAQLPWYLRPFVNTSYAYVDPGPVVYWQKITITSPNSISSNQANIIECD